MLHGTNLGLASEACGQKSAVCGFRGQGLDATAAPDGRCGPAHCFADGSFFFREREFYIVSGIVVRLEGRDCTRFFLIVKKKKRKKKKRKERRRVE